MKAKILKEALNSQEILVAPGASCALYARLIELAGFKVVYATGAGMANMQFGFPDIGLVSMNEMLENTKRINDATNLPVIADIDNGYGNALNVYRTAKEFSKNKIAAIQIEDQQLPKRCGHFDGKKLISQDEMCAKIKACKDALEYDTLIIARTDAIAVNGFDDAINRANAYLESGADILFIEAPTSIEQMASLPKLVKAYHIANMVEGGKTPILSNDELQKMGFNIVLYANATLKAAIKGMNDLLNHLKTTGRTDNAEHLMISIKERNRICEFDKWMDIENKFKG